jgi:hypothetical protein
MKTKYPNVFINPDEDDVHHMPHRTPIAFDMDSVMNNMGSDLGHYIADHFGVTFGSVHDYDTITGFQKFMFKVPDVSGNAIRKVVHKFILEESPSAMSTPWLHSVMRYVYSVTGMPITVITARPPETVDVTHNWLLENLASTPFTCYMTHGISKAPVLELIHADIFVDDRWKTILRLMGEIEYPVLYRRPWNVGRPVPLPVLNIRDLRDIIPLLNIKIGRVPTAWPERVPYPNTEGE